MPRYRIEFSKGDQVRFLSHLDLVKAFERAIRRAEIPIAFSEGFNPHPKMNFASALGVGVTSDSEYLDIELKYTVDIKALTGSLARSLPQGIRVRAVRAVPDKAPALMSVVNRAEYRVVAGTTGVVEEDNLSGKISEFLNVPVVEIIKKTKKGFRPKNIRPGILGLKGCVTGNGVEFRIRTLTGNDGNVRPEEIITALTGQSGLALDEKSLYIRRTGLYVEKEGETINPMDYLTG